MKRSLTKIVVISLIAAFLGINAWLPLQAMGHAHTHEHHDAATHATPLCTLLCSAGHMAPLTDPIPPFVLSSLDKIDPLAIPSRLILHASSRFARGPPADTTRFFSF